MTGGSATRSLTICVSHGFKIYTIYTYTILPKFYEQLFTKSHMLHVYAHNSVSENCPK